MVGEDQQAFRSGKEGMGSRIPMSMFVGSEVANIDLIYSLGWGPCGLTLVNNSRLVDRFLESAVMVAGYLMVLSGRVQNRSR